MGPGTKTEVGLGMGVGTGVLRGMGVGRGVLTGGGVEEIRGVGVIPELGVSPLGDVKRGAEDSTGVGVSKPTWELYSGAFSLLSPGSLGWGLFQEKG